MNVGGWLINLATKALAESMDVRTMVHLAKRFFPNYDLNERTGFPQNIAIPNLTAAEQIVKDIKKSELFLDFVSLLIDIRESGLMGRKYRVPYLREILGEMQREGIIYDEASRTFFEDAKVCRTRNWGVLREGQEYIITFLHIDVVGNTNLVRVYSPDIVKKTYNDLQKIVKAVCEARNGRIWSWEGDGGLAAFYIGNKNNHAALSALEILHELYIYNLIGCRLNEPLGVRIAVHSGPCEYSHSFSEINSETIKALEDMESRYTQPDTATFSSTVYRMLNHIILEQLTPVEAGSQSECYFYSMRWGG